MVAQLWAVSTEAAAVLVRPASSHGLPLGCGGAGGHIPHALVYGGEHTCVTFFPAAVGGKAPIQSLVSSCSGCSRDEAGG